MTTGGHTASAAETKSDLEQQQRTEHFVEFFTDQLVPKQKRKENMKLKNMMSNDKNSSGGPEVETVEKTAKFV